MDIYATNRHLFELVAYALILNNNDRLNSSYESSLSFSAFGQ